MNHYEDAESMALWQRAQLDPILREYLYHVPNGGKRNVKEAARMKRMGVRKGVHDYHLPVARGAYHSLWIELKPVVKETRGANKTKTPKATPEQYEWRDLMREQGNAAYIIHGWDRAVAIMLAYLTLGHESYDGETWFDLHPDDEIL